MLVKFIYFGGQMQNSNILSNLSNKVDMNEFYDELEGDIEMVSGVYYSLAKVYKKGGSRKFKHNK